MHWYSSRNDDNIYEVVVQSNGSRPKRQFCIEEQYPDAYFLLHRLLYKQF